MGPSDIELGAGVEVEQEAQNNNQNLQKILSSNNAHKMGTDQEITTPVYEEVSFNQSENSTNDENFTFSVITKNKGILTKILSLKDGKVIKDGSQCNLGFGKIKKYNRTIVQFATRLRILSTKQALVHGISEHQEAVICSKAKFDRVKRKSESMPVITRSKEYLFYSEGPGLMMFDHDKASDNAVALSDEALKAYKPAELIAVVGQCHSEIKVAAYVSTPSTSACIFDKDGNELRGEGDGSHIYLFPMNANDIPRYMDVLGKRLILAGYGRIEISRSGSLLIRALVDLSVGSPERLDFVAGPECEDGLEQRLPDPYLHEGDFLDTKLLRNLTSAETLKYEEIVRELKEKAKPTQENIRDSYIEAEAIKLTKSGKVDIDSARTIVRSRQDHLLDDNDQLFFAHNKGKPITVAQALDAGDEYHAKSLADPLEPDYDGGSLTKAKFYWNDGQPGIRSFAHGSIKYRFMRFEEEPTWSFEDAELTLLNVHQDAGSTTSRGRIDLAEEIIKHNNFTVLENEMIRNMIKDHLKITKGAQDDVGKTVKKAMDHVGGYLAEMTHYDIAMYYIQKQLPKDLHPVGAEGAIWGYNDEKGLYEKSPLTDIEIAIGSCQGDNCKRGSDYKAIARLVYLKLLHENFFSDAPYGVAVKSSFIRITNDLSVQHEPYTPDHRQRYKLLADPEKLDAPMFFQYLNDTFSGDDCEHEIALLQEIMGGLVTGCFNRLQRAVLLIGPGSNGKSVFLELLEKMFPPGVTCAVSPNYFDNEYYKAELAGKVINIIGELDKTKPLRSAFKDVIGCDTPISARMPYKEPFKFKPTAGHIFASNHFPQTNDHTNGFYRRWVIVKFKNIVPDNKKIPNLGAKIAAVEMPQVLSWALQGAARLVANKFNLPLTDSHEKELEKWKNTKDSVFCFLGDDDVVKCVSSARTPKKDAYAVYRKWSGDMGVKAVGYNEFVERCSLKFKEVKRSGERRCFGDMKLLVDVNDGLYKF